ncbi:MAG: ATP phosphoribosyltransferase [Acidimicrobiia bacterium]
MLKLVLPKGSLEDATIRLFDEADLSIQRRSARDYKADIDDARIESVRFLRPQEIPHYVADGLFDAGITGRDWIEETGADVVSVTELRYSKSTSRPVLLVLAVAESSPYKKPSDLAPGIRVSTEYPRITSRYFEKLGIEVKIQLSYGATEAKVPDIVDAIVDNTETGASLRAAGVRIIDTLLESYPELIVNASAWQDLSKRKALEEIAVLLRGALDARGRVLIKLNVSSEKLKDVVEVLPSMKSPTVSTLHGGKYFAVETVVPKSGVNELIPLLKDRGAEDIVEMPISKIVL